MSSCKSIYCKNRIAGSSSKHNGSVLVVDDEKDIVITIEAFFTRVRWFQCEDIYRCIFSANALSSIL